MKMQSRKYCSELSFKISFESYPLIISASDRQTQMKQLICINEQETISKLQKIGKV